MMASRRGVVKKTPWKHFRHSAGLGVIAINLKDMHRLVSAQDVGDRDELVLVSRNGLANRFTLRTSGRLREAVGVCGDSGLRMTNWWAWTAFTSMSTS